MKQKVVDWCQIVLEILNFLKMKKKRVCYARVNNASKIIFKKHMYLITEVGAILYITCATLLKRLIRKGILCQR